MKYYIKLVAVALSLGLGLTACQKDYDSTPDVTKDPTQNPLKGTFTCKTNGDLFVAHGKSVSLSDNNGIKTLTIVGIKYSDDKKPNVGQIVTLTVPVYEGAQRYGVSGAARVTYTSTDASGTSLTYMSLSNENYFVKVDGAYSGSFNAVVANTANGDDKIVISEGKFDIPE